MPPFDSPTSVYTISVTLTFFVISKVPFYTLHTFNIGPEVVLAARWRPAAEIKSSLDSPISYRQSVGIFRQSFTVQNLLKCFELEGTLAFR
jgi:hypothetical protein